MTTQVLPAVGTLHSRCRTTLCRLRCAVRVERRTIATSKIVTRHNKISSRLQEASSLLSDVQLVFYDICSVLYESRPDLFVADYSTLPRRTSRPYMEMLTELVLRVENSRYLLDKAKSMVDVALTDCNAAVVLLDLALPDPVGRISTFSETLYDFIDYQYKALDRMLDLADTAAPVLITQKSAGVWANLAKAAGLIKRMMPKLYQCWSVTSLGAENVDDALVNDRILRSFQDDHMPVWLQKVMIDDFDKHPEEKARFAEQLAKQDEEALSDVTNAKALNQIASEQTMTELSYVKAELKGVFCRRVRQPAEKGLCRAVKPSLG